MSAVRAAALALGVACLLACSAAVAAAAPLWTVVSSSNTTTPPGSAFTFYVDVKNVGDTDTAPGDAYTLTASMPPGLTITGGSDLRRVFSCPAPSDPGTLTCTATVSALHGIIDEVQFSVDVDPAASGVLAAAFSVGGAGAAPASTVDPVRIAADPPPFGVDAFDAQLTADASGTAYTQAGGHPLDLRNDVAFNTAHDAALDYTFLGTFAPGDVQPIEPAKDVSVDLPPGLVGDPSAVPQCTNTDLAYTVPPQGLPLCAPASQVGTVVLTQNGQDIGDMLGPIPVFNMVPPPGVPARFGFNAAGTVVVLDASVRTGGDYGVTVTARNSPEGIALAGAHFDFWGVPADPIHDVQRACPGQPGPGIGGPSCPSGAPPAAFLRMPTSCPAPGDGLPWTLRADSWVHPGAFVQTQIFSHRAPGYPLTPSGWGAPQGPDGCDAVPFEPAFSAQPASGSTAGEPAALTFELTIPQSDDPTHVAQSDLRRAVVTLPAGVRVSPASADGLQACSSAQIALGGAGEPACPDASKIATVEVDTPLLDVPLEGGLFLAKPFDNPFDSLLAVYLVASAKGVVVKLPGLVSTDPVSGQITTTFDDTPQLPFSRLRIAFPGGPRSALTLPDGCGTYTTHAQLTGWNGRETSVDDRFTLTQNAAGQACPSTFSPGFSAGTASNGAGRSSSFLLRISRNDEDQQLERVAVHLPAGLTGAPTVVPLCAEADANAGTCPDGTKVGDVTVGAGAGPDPFFITNGRAYLTGPYEGAPFGLDVVVPAVAGPFDLGTVNVRQALFVDRHDATVRVVSDPLPTILQGIPLDVRDVRVDLDRPGFMRNPTSCAVKRIDATVQSVAGAQASVSDRFQAAECGSLAFRPALSLGVGAPGRTAARASVPLTARLKLPSGGANLRFVRVTLPSTIAARLPVIERACTRAQFEAGDCAGARAGTVVARTPLLRDPLRGGAYFVKNGHALPDLFLALRGQVSFDLIGRVSIPGGTRLATTFAAVPDVPVTSFALRFVVGGHGPLGAATNLCSATSRRATAAIDFIGQNGAVEQVDQRPVVHGCGARRGSARRAGRRR